MSFSEKYQAFLDKINTRIPIKWLTSPMDKKFPLASLFVFLLIIIIVLILIFANPFTNGNGAIEYTTIVVKIADEKGVILSNFSFKVRDELTSEEKEYLTDNSGKKEITLIKGGSYTFIVEKKGYAAFSESIDTSNSEFKVILKLFELPLNTTKTLSFVDSKTKETIKEDLDLVIKCEKGKVIDPSALKVVNGQYTIDLPTDCGSLVATIKNNNYYASGVLIPVTQSVVGVTKIGVVTETGTINVTVKSGDNFIDDILIKLFEKDDLINPIKTTNTTWSSAKIKDIPVGDYKLVASDSSNKYLSVSIDITVIKNATLEKTLNLLAVNAGTGTATGGDANITVETRTITALIKDEAGLDMNTPEAKVVLLLDCNSMQDQRTTTQGISFVVDKAKEYCLRGEAQGYIPEVKPILSDINSYTFNLVKKTISNVSDINVSVIDEDGLAVVGAKLLLYDGNTGYIDTRFNSELTDVNGKATFSEIPLGYFYVKVKKVYLEGDSTKFNHFPPNDTNVNVIVNVGQGTIELLIKNKQGDFVPEADIKIYTEDNNILGTDFASSSGTYSKKIKADKRIYVVVTKDGYISYFTELLTIYKNKTINKEIVLDRDNCVSDNPCTDFLGVFTPEGEVVDKLQNNKVYNFKYRITNGASASTMGFILKIGEEEKVEDDIVYIKPVTTSNAVATYFADYPFISAVPEGTNAKLVDVFFSPTEKGTYELTIPIQVHDAKDQDLIPVYYKAYYSPINYLNNEIFDMQEYYVGVDELCSQTFCFSGQYVDVINNLRYDIGADLKIPMLVNSDYSLEYKIKNAKSTSYQDARLKVFNSDKDDYPTSKVNIKSYDISGSFNKAENSNTSNYKIPFTEDEITSTQISPYQETNYLVNLYPQVVDVTKLRHQIIAGQQEIYNLNLNLLSKNLYNMVIGIQPENILPDTTFDMLVTIKDETGKPVTNAMINIYSKLGNYETPIFLEKYTDSAGNLNLNMPPLVVGETLVIESQKSGYFAERKEITIDANIVSVLFSSSPVTIDNPVAININKNNLTGDTESVEILNLTNYDLTLDEFGDTDFSFDYANLLNIGQTHTYLNSQVTTGGSFIIPAGEKKTLEIKMSPGEDSKNLVENQVVLGSITGHVSKDNGTRYPFNIPIQTTISVGKGVATDNCLVAQGYVNPWVTTINSGGSQSISFTIINNCRDIDNPETPLKLKNIRAKILSEGDKYGYYDLTIDASTARLAEGVYKTVIEGIDSDRLYAGTLKYSSGGIKFGLVKTKIYLNGQVETESGLAYVNNGDGEILLNTEINIMEISDCFKFYDGTKEIGDAGMFVVESDIIVGQTKDLTIKNTCADKGRFRVTLSGGMAESSNGLSYENYDDRPNGDYEYRFNASDSEKIIPVRKPDVPGAYTIEVKIESINNNDRAVATVFRPLKVNIKDLLYMEDPFIEVSPDSTTMPVKLYNKDIEKTPWDYVTNYAGEVGFSKYINNEYYNGANYKADYDSHWSTCSIGDNKCLYESENSILRMRFNEDDKLSNAGAQGLNYLTSIGAGVVAAGAVIGICLLLTAVLATVPVVGWVAAAVLVIAGAIAPSFYSDYDIDNHTRYLDVSTMDIIDGGEVSKIITLSTLEDQNTLINVFDITGARYHKYYNQQIFVHGKLAGEKEISTELTKCNGLGHMVPVTSFLKVHDKPAFCGETTLEESESSYTYKTSCSGQVLDRFELNLWYDAYSICRYDQVYWADQAGVKPLEFKLNASVLDTLSNASTIGIYKTMIFYPTLDDSVDNVDSAFMDAKPISQNGKFRFQFHKTPTKEIPNVDLNVYSCSTDSDKIGKTGPGAVPNVSFDWDWEDFSNTNKCTETYCDAVQLSQMVVNRLYATQKLLDSKSTNISCPLSYQQMIDNALEGTYEASAKPSSVTNTIPAGKIGISNVYLQVQENKLRVKVVIENRTTGEVPGTVSISLADKDVISIETRDLTTGEFISETVTPTSNHTYSKSLNIPIGNDNTSEIIFTYQEGVLGDDLPLKVTYTGGVAEYVTFNTIVDLGLHPAAATGCQVPATTVQFNGTDYIDMWFNKEQYPANVKSEWSQEDINLLKTTLSFNAYLITDNYNSNFQDAFDKAYGGKASVDQGLGTYSFMASPETYSHGYLSPLFKDNLEFTLKYSLNNQGVEVKTPGLYNVRIDLIFNNFDWKFTTAGDKVDVNAIVTFTYLKGPQDNSVFYRLPFDGFVGYQENGYNRQGYGVSYLGDNVLITKIKDNDLRTNNDQGSNPLKYLTVENEQDFFKLNSEVESRGSVLKVFSESDDQTRLVFSPSNPTPVIMKVENTRLKPFSIYYQLVDDIKSEPVYGALNLTKWNGIGDGCDYSGDYIYSVFNNTFDVATQSDERILSSYKIDWAVVNSKGNVYLRSIFYTPINGSYSLNSKSTENRFSIDGDRFDSTIGLPGKNAISLNSIKDVFDNIDNNNICVTNSPDGTYSEFFWNPVAIYNNNENYMIGPEDRLKCN